MPAHHKTPRAGTGRPCRLVEGVTPGGTEHKILLALRAPGGLTPEQITARFGHVSGALHRLKVAGLVVLGGTGQKGLAVGITARGRALTESSGPLNRARNLITYCQL